LFFPNVPESTLEASAFESGAPVFIYARPLLPVAAALGVALLILWLERECNSPQIVSLEGNTANQTTAESVPEQRQLTKL
jgi:hypothetical protein